MTTVARLLAEALRLTDDEREELAVKLLDSLPHSPLDEPEVDAFARAAPKRDLPN